MCQLNSQIGRGSKSEAKDNLDPSTARVISEEDTCSLCMYIENQILCFHVFGSVSCIYW